MCARERDSFPRDIFKSDPLFTFRAARVFPIDRRSSFLLCFPFPFPLAPAPLAAARCPPPPPSLPLAGPPRLLFISFLFPLRGKLFESRDKFLSTAQ